MAKPKMCIVQTRPLGIGDLVFALRGKKTSYSSLEILDQAGLVKQLKPEWEHSFVEAIVETHPVYEKNFEHVLVNPPKGILPSDVLQAFHERSKLVPTLLVVHFQNDRPVLIKKVRDYYEILSLLSDAREDGLVPEREETIC